MRVKVVPDFSALVFTRAPFESLGDVPLIGLREPAIDDFNGFIKRLVDVILSLVFLNYLRRQMNQAKREKVDKAKRQKGAKAEGEKVDKVKRETVMKEKIALYDVVLDDFEWKGGVEWIYDYETGFDAGWTA